MRKLNQQTFFLTIFLFSVSTMAQENVTTKADDTAQVSEAQADTGDAEVDMPPAPFAEETVSHVGIQDTSYRFNETGPIISLKRAHQLTQKNNPSYHNVNEQIYQSETLIQSAWGMLLPNLSANAKLIRNKNEAVIPFQNVQVDPATNGFAGVQTIPITMQEKWQSSLGFTANMTLFNARSIPLIKYAYDSVEQTKLKAQISRNDLLFAATSAYYQIANFKELISVYSDNVNVAKESLRMATARKMVGQGTKIDVMRAQIQVKESERKLDDALDAYRTAKRSLALFLGIKGDFQIVMPRQIDMAQKSEKELTQDALKKRIELKSADMDVTMVKRLHNETKFKWVPVVDVTWQLDIASVGGMSGENANWMLIFGANWSILEGGVRVAELNKRKSQIRMAQNQIKQLELDIKTDISQKVQDKISKKRNWEVSAELVALAEENHNMISRQYQVGMANSLELTDAANELANQKIMLAVAKLQYELAVLTLGKTAGEYNALAVK